MQEQSAARHVPRRPDIAPPPPPPHSPHAPSDGNGDGDAAFAAGASTFASPVPPGASSVLIVDDNQTVARALSQLIRRAGFDTVPCHCGEEAMAYARVAIPGAAVVDVHLPDINGLVLAQKLRERFGPHTPIIVVSGDTSMETLNSLSHVGATYFFSKPLNADALVERLKALVGGT